MLVNSYATITLSIYSLISASSMSWNHGDIQTFFICCNFKPLQCVNQHFYFRRFQFQLLYSSQGYCYYYYCCYYYFESTRKLFYTICPFDVARPSWMHYGYIQTCISNLMMRYIYIYMYFITDFHPSGKKSSISWFSSTEYFKYTIF